MLTSISQLGALKERYSNNTDNNYESYFLLNLSKASFGYKETNYRANYLLISDYRLTYLKCCVKYVANGRQASVQYLHID